MSKSVFILLLFLLPAVATAAERPPWAFGPERTGEAVARKPDDGVLKQAPGSARRYTQAQIDDPMHPPDWFPDEHPPMPRVVAHGNGTTVRACIGCHLALKGLGDVPGIAGQSPITIARQLYDMRSGDRRGAMAALMKAVVDKLDADDLLAISAYVASREP